MNPVPTETLLFCVGCSCTGKYRGNSGELLKELHQCGNIYSGSVNVFKTIELLSYSALCLLVKRNFFIPSNRHDPYFKQKNKILTCQKIFG